jgi:hypothetical protein
MRTEFGEWPWYYDKLLYSVELLTKSNNIGCYYYIKRIREDEIARKVKIQDIIHNLEPVRMARLKEGVNLDKYREALRLLLD